MPHVSTKYLAGLALVGVVTVALSIQAQTGGSPEQLPSTLGSVDFVDATYVIDAGKVAVAGRNGTLGWVSVDKQGAKFSLAVGVPHLDFTSIGPLGSGQALVGAEDGGLYRFGNGEFEKVAQLSEFEEPVLDIARAEDGFWAVGARGIMARSQDGQTWRDAAPEEVEQPAISLPVGVKGEISFGVANIDAESFQLHARANGKPLVLDEDYELYAEEGLLLLNVPLDAETPPTVTFRFSPGPAFRRGDVSWNIVLAERQEVIVAGEFGLILHSQDNGESWVRRAGYAALGEQQVRYWLAGDWRDERVVLVGAGGAIVQSADSGRSWTDLDSPSQEGIFGALLNDMDELLIFGAVGLAGVFDGNEWHLADRTQLRLLSWLRTPVTLPDGGMLAFGGRSTILNYAARQWARMHVAGS